jgi:hypothetical protein
VVYIFRLPPGISSSEKMKSTPMAR